jgi:cyanuric acid amidohydrolase
MRSTQVLVYEMAHPEDCSGLARDLAQGVLQPGDIRAVFIKTEGNGLDNDWSRPLALRALAQHLPAAVDAAGGAAVGTTTPPMLVASGGCEGMLTPHMTVIAVAGDVWAGATTSFDGQHALAVGSFLSEPLQATDLGREAHGLMTRQAVERACADAGLATKDVVAGHVLSPWMGRDLLAAAPAGSSLVADGAHASKPAIRAAAALGAALALGEITSDEIAWSSSGPSSARRATRVAVTAGDTGGRIQVLVLGHARGWSGPLRVASTQMADMLDVEAIATARRGKLVAAFFKGDPPAGGLLRGARTTMGADSDIHAFRHFRAAMSGVFGAALGTPRVFIGGGAEFQSQAGGGLLITIYSTEPSDKRPAHQETSA